MKFNEIKDLKKYHLIHHDELIEKNIVEIFQHDQYDLNEIVVELIQHHDVDVDVVDDNKFIFYYVDEKYQIDEILNNINIDKYEIIENDDDEHEFIVVVDPENFHIKNSIENYDELLKYFRHDYLIDELIENTIEYKYIKNNSIATNLLNDYYHKNLYLYKKFINLYKFDDDVELNIDLLYKFKKIFDDEFIDDVELYHNIFEIYDDVELYKNYDVELFDDELIYINHDEKIIKNVDDEFLYEFVVATINKYLKLNNNVELLHDEIIELLNIISYEFFIVEFDDLLYKINLSYDYNFKISDMKKLNEFIHEIENIYDVFKFDDDVEIHDVELIDPENIIELFDVDDVVEFIENDVEINYDYYNYENYVALNNLFYDIFKKYHNKIDEKIYDNIRKIRSLNR